MVYAQVLKNRRKGLVITGEKKDYKVLLKKKNKKQDQIFRENNIDLAKQLAEREYYGDGTREFLTVRKNINISEKL